MRSCHRLSLRTSGAAMSTLRQLLGSGGQGGGRTLGLEALGPPAVLVPVVPQVREMRQHLARKQIDVVLAQRSRHGAEVQEREQVPHARALDAVDELLAHGLRASNNDEAAVEQVLGLEFAQIDAGAGIVAQRLHERLVFETAGN